MNRAGSKGTTTSVAKRRTRGVIFRSLAFTTAGALAVFGGGSAAFAAPGDDSAATGTFLGGSILDLIDLDDIASLEGAEAANDGVPDETVTDYNTLDLSVLGGVVTVTSPTGVQIPIDLASLGVLGQYASAAPDGSSVGASGLVGEGGAIGTGVDPLPGQAPGPLTLDLTQAVASLGTTGAVAAPLVDDLADVGLTVEAVSASASQAAPAAPVGDYEIAGATLTLQSDTIAGLSDAVDAALPPLQATVDGLQTGLVADLLDLLPLLDVELLVGTTSLTDEVSGLLTGTLTSPTYAGISVNLDTGEIVVDLAEIVDLNNLSLGAEILSGDTIELIQTAVLDLVEGALDTVTQALTDAIEGLTIEGGISAGAVEVVGIDTSVGDILDGDLSGVTLLDESVSLPGGLGAITAVLGDALDGLIPDVTDLVAGVLLPVNTVLLPALDAVLPAVVSLTANNQSTAGGVFSETALILTVLPLLGIDAVTLELANATVGPNAIDANIDVSIAAPADGDQFFVLGPDDLTDVTVSGAGQPGANVEVVVDGQTQAVPVSDPGGLWTTTFTDLPVGDYTATATQDVDGSSATVAFEVAEVPDVEILSPEDGATIPVAGPGDTADVPVSGTGYAGAEVEVVVGGATETTTVLGDGTWTVTFDDLPIGDYTATATQEFDGSTTEVDFAVAEITDVAIDTPADGDILRVDDPTDTTEVVVSGTGYDGETVTVVIPGLPDQTATVVDGEWSVTFPGAPVGDHTATATQSGDGSTASVDFSIVATTDVTITDPDDGEVIVVPEPGDTTDVEVCGAGHPGAEIIVTVGGLPPVTVTVGEDGTWCVVVPNVPEGEHEVTAEQPDDGSGTTVVIVVEEAADVTIVSPAPGEEVPAAVGEVVDVPVTGTGQPGEAITVVLDAGEILGTVVGEDGTWEVVFEDVPVGPHEVVATQVIDGSTATAEFEVVDVITPVEIVTPADGAQLNVPSDGDLLTLLFTGTGEPGAQIEVMLEGATPVETVTVGDDGTWTAEFADRGVGSYTATATQDLDGSTDTVTVSVAVGPIDTSDARASVAEKRLVRGPGVWQTVYVTGFQPGETVSATVNSTPFDLPAVTADANGSALFTFAVDAGFELGDHRVEVRGSLTGELPVEREDTAFTVVAGAALSVTGGDPAGTLLIGGIALGLLLVGATLRMWRRRAEAQ